MKSTRKKSWLKELLDRIAEWLREPVWVGEGCLGMKWTKIYWDQLRDGDVFRVRVSPRMASEELTVVKNMPRKWKLVFDFWDAPGLRVEGRYLEMGGSCERLQ